MVHVKVECCFYRDCLLNFIIVFSKAEEIILVVMNGMFIEEEGSQPPESQNYLEMTVTQTKALSSTCFFHGTEEGSNSLQGHLTTPGNVYHSYESLVK